jgi:hypothetical protein
MDGVWARSEKEVRGPCSILGEDDLQLQFANSERCRDRRRVKRVFGYRPEMILSRMRKFEDQNEHFVVQERN